MTIGRAIKTVRTKRGIGQQQLAKKAKISQGFLSLLEKGRRTPSLKMTRGLANALGVPTELLLLMGCESKKTKRYSKQIRRITSWVDSILIKISRSKR